MSAVPSARDETSALGRGQDSSSDEIVLEERRRAVRLLLSHPLVTAEGPDPDDFLQVRRHDRWLVDWFRKLLGYRLAVDADMARLHKRPAPDARARPARSQSGTPFDPRRYALLCLTLAALERLEMQTVLSELAEQVQVLASSEEGITPLDLDRYAERQALVDVVRSLVELRVLTLADGDDTAFLQGKGDALYDIHGRRLGQILATSHPPSLAADPEEIAAETYPATDEGANLRIRHRLMRRLVEEPVLYLDRLDPDELAYLTSQRSYLARQLSDAVGLELEIRREGLAAIDPQGGASDLEFPATGTVSHAALLLAELLAARGRSSAFRDAADRVVPRDDVRGWVEDLVRDHGSVWSKAYTRDEAGIERLTTETLDRLAAFDLVQWDAPAQGVVPLPAIARYRPLPVDGAGS